ncbi:hypothetical protein [Flavobacterium selenitireducens]|uniref:hypothetical protein n=1 Tax=Flavobacterium selenitireducens TaxID=2722704 RepID=UPI00168AA7FD|nr:hypothetical protein [Flavobacterium selenitireducens]MBD3581572.1 hypothetical protein [Flavobacterium selenitireducens]
MSYRGIFFRASEIENLQNEYSAAADKIFNDAQVRFSNISSLEQLYARVGKLKNSESILTSFRIKTQNSYLQRGSIQDPWVGAFTQSPSDVHRFNFFGSEFIFYSTLVVVLFLIISFFTKLKFLKTSLATLFLVLVIINIVNWQIIEPRKIAEAKDGLNLDKYEDHINDMLACKVFDSLYHPTLGYRKSPRSTPSNYHYDVIGKDGDGSEVTGTVDVNSESGSGNITLNGQDKYITVEWQGHGELIGHDNDGKVYNLEVN